jgi:DNA helicase II / ATP-dependent DNA helicase PcrA
LTKILLIASAGAGKTHRIAKEACELTKDHKRILIITYTRSNQREIEHKCHTFGGAKQGKIEVKGWYSFLLEDVIRPYQKIFFDKRIESIHFNSSNPHKRGNSNVYGTAEEFDGVSVNHKHYLTSNCTKAHTEFLSKLAARIIKVKGEGSVKRINDLYDYIFIDEVQDLAGWDYDLLHPLFRSTIPVICVGDFRQTIYDTTSNPKKPNLSNDKLSVFKKLKFKQEEMAVSRRCIQSICDYADAIHHASNFPQTKSLVDNISEEFTEHLGVFAIPSSMVDEYINHFMPVILRDSKISAKHLNIIPVEKINFGQSKGLSYNRTLIVPTKNIESYLLGNNSAFGKLKTDKAINRFYVAVTRARYSVGFIIDDNKLGQVSLPIWKDPT